MKQTVKFVWELQCRSGSLQRNSCSFSSWFSKSDIYSFRPKDWTTTCAVLVLWLPTCCTTHTSIHTTWWHHGLLLPRCWKHDPTWTTHWIHFKVVDWLKLIVWLVSHVVLCPRWVHDCPGWLCISSTTTFCNSARNNRVSARVKWTVLLWSNSLFLLPLLLLRLWCWMVWVRFKCQSVPDKAVTLFAVVALNITASQLQKSISSTASTPWNQSQRASRFEELSTLYFLKLL